MFCCFAMRSFLCCGSEFHLPFCLFPLGSLPCQDSNLNSSESESDVLPVTPQGNGENSGALGRT